MQTIGFAGVGVVPKMRNKTWILPACLMIIIVLAMAVSAFDTNESIRIYATYEINDVAQNISAAGLTIYLPNGLIDVGNASMNKSGLRFFYDYTTPSTEGEYTAIASYYNPAFLANETSTFWVGDVNVLAWGVCPTGTQGWVGMWILFIVLAVLGIIGMVSRMPMLSLFTGGFLILLSLITWRCGDIIGYASIFIGLVYLLGGLSTKT